MRAGAYPPSPQQAPIAGAVDATTKTSAGASNITNVSASHGVVVWSYVIVMALFLWALFVQKRKR